MDQMTKNRTSRPRVPQHDCHGRECASGARNNYFLGKKMTPDSYAMEQRYAMDRRRLVNRAVHGWGVVYGFALSLENAGGLQIGEGFALDRRGRELIQPDPTVLSLDNFVILDDNGKPRLADGDLAHRIDKGRCGDDKCWLLTAHYAEKTLGPVRVKDPCHCDHDEWDRVCETIIYALQPIDCAECCEDWECSLHCCCPDSRCCHERDGELQASDKRWQEIVQRYEEELRRADGSDPKVRENFERQLEVEAEKRREIVGHDDPRGGCACLCRHVSRPTHGDGRCNELTDVGDCTRADLSDGVKLACLRIVEDDCHDLVIQIEDDCGPRRTVKSANLLFDLINGCDLTKIDETGWAKWHRRSEPPVPFDEFKGALGWDENNDYTENSTRDFWVRFSRPVRADTLKPDAFVMVVMTDESDDSWREYQRVPILAIETDQVPAETDDPAGHVRSARLVVSTDWLTDAVSDKDDLFTKGVTRVEIEVRGDLIEDCLGQQVDANSRGRSAYPTGNGSPGGTYLSTFTVAQRVVPPKQSKPAKPPAPPLVRQSGPSATRVR